MFGRRPDGRRVKNIDPVMRITPYVMPMRCDAQVMMRHRVELEPVVRYISSQKKNGEAISRMQLIVAAYVRAVSRTPEVNRFIMNKQFFARNNCSVAFTVLKDMADIDKGEAVVKIKFDLTDTIYDVRDRMERAVKESREDEQNGFANRLLGFLFAAPGVATLATGIVRFLDRYGLAPSVLMEELPLYVGMYVTNTASIGLHDVNHHIYNWGNVGLFLSIGFAEKSAVDVDGKTVMKRFIPVGVTADERVCSGAHYARFFSDFRRYLKHPELLEVPPEEVRFDQGLEYHEPKINKEH